MLRAVLLGVLSLSAVACKSSSESAKSQPGAVAGRVLEVSGTVTVRHGDVARPLGKGDTVEADDTIETGADGHVVVELAHNGATWELSANKTSKVRDSLAWSEPKRDKNAKAVEQDTAAAGRPAERNAADTTASAAEAPMAPAAEASPAQATAVPPPGAAAVVAAPEPAPKRRAPADAKAAPNVERARDLAPPPPPPPPTEATEATEERRELAPPRAAVRATGGAAGGPASGEQVSLLRAKTNDITACWAGQKMTVQMHIVIKADGTASATLSSKEKLTPQIEACVKKVISTVEFPAKAAVISIGFSSTP